MFENKTFAFVNKFRFYYSFQLVVWLFVLILTVQIHGEIERRIDWVGEPNHAQPQDAPLARNVQLERIRSSTDAGQEIIAQNHIDANVDDDDDDLQQRQEPIFGKGTYLEFRTVQ